ncbi:hypothetical protein C4573_04540 [Candidatus Woesearchaeota archaeon]|nr:MAG: hypothetical protein C4573_04540 [Candidatus Woesearchaeota archaeon]
MVPKITKLHFGTGGIPLSTEPRNIDNGIRQIKQLGLSCMEMEFVQSVFITKETAPKVKESAKKEEVVLTAHGSYYINLNAKEKDKLDASIQRILAAARITSLCGGYSITFHPAFYLKDAKEQVYETVKQQLKTIIKTLQNESVDVWIRPETTGKPTQFGDYLELLKLSSEIEQIMPCVDFAHLHARSNGKFNTYEEFAEVLTDIEKFLGKEGLQNMHIHMSGINYGEKGEKNHLELKDSDFQYKELMKAFKEFKIKGVVICESPNLEKDALLMKKEYER